MTPDDFSKVRPLADKLMASCQPSELWEELNELSEAECKALDTIAFECVGCNQWFSQQENVTPKASEWRCKDCADQ